MYMCVFVRSFFRPCDRSSICFLARDLFVVSLRLQSVFIHLLFTVRFYCIYELYAGLIRLDDCLSRSFEFNFSSIGQTKHRHCMCKCCSKEIYLTLNVLIGLLRFCAHTKRSSVSFSGNQPWSKIIKLIQTIIRRGNFNHYNYMSKPVDTRKYPQTKQNKNNKNQPFTIGKEQTKF